MGTSKSNENSIKNQRRIIDVSITKFTNGCQKLVHVLRQEDREYDNFSTSDTQHA